MKSIQECKEILMSNESRAWEKYNCQSLLRTRSKFHFFIEIGDDESAQAQAETYPYLGTSELCRHDVMYNMGQMRRSNSLEFLMNHLKDKEEQPIVRHEAAEALSNFFDISQEIVKVYDELLANEPDMAPILKSTLVVGKISY